MSNDERMSFEDFKVIYFPEFDSFKPKSKLWAEILWENDRFVSVTELKSNPQIMDWSEMTKNKPNNVEKIGYDLGYLVGGSIFSARRDKYVNCRKYLGEEDREKIEIFKINSKTGILELKLTPGNLNFFGPIFRGKAALSVLELFLSRKVYSKGGSDSKSKSKFRDMQSEFNKFNLPLGLIDLNEEIRGADKNYRFVLK